MYEKESAPDVTVGGTLFLLLPVSYTTENPAQSSASVICETVVLSG